jgi:hypothetical protein
VIHAGKIGGRADRSNKYQIVIQPTQLVAGSTQKTSLPTRRGGKRIFGAQPKTSDCGLQRVDGGKQLRASGKCNAKQPVLVNRSNQLGQIVERIVSVFGWSAV